MITRKS